MVADVHSNLEAFQSVILDAEGLGGFGQLWSVGDVVGYGPNRVHRTHAAVRRARHRR